jgi:hypothetical protein
MTRFAALILAAGSAALAQTQPQSQSQPQPPNASLPNAAVSGVVKDSVTGQPLANYNVSTYINATWRNDTIFMSSTSKQVQSVTDELGRYKIADLPAGPYRIEARSAEGFGSNVTKRVTLAGQDLELDFKVVVQGSISGKVIDEYKEPVPGLTVWLVSREYYGGALGYFFKEQAATNDRGEYTLRRVEAGPPYLVMVEKRNPRQPARAETPLDPKLRRRVPMRTFYPNATTKEGAAAIMVRPGEHRENVDIEVKKSANYCIEAALSSPMGPGEFMFGVEGAQPASGMSSGGGMMGYFLSTSTGADGKLRVCDLSPGVYRLAAMERTTAPNPQGPMPNHAMTLITVADRDVQGLKIALGHGPTIQGEVVWDGAAPVDPGNTKVRIFLQPLMRSGLQGESPSAQPAIPGSFTLSNLVTGDYTLRTMLNANGLYVKDVTYSGNSIMNQPLRTGETMDSTLTVVMGRDPATITARVTNKDGVPLADMAVLILPTEAASPAALQATMAIGSTDQQGQYTSHPLAPGKYYVMATEDRVNATPESIDRLWSARNRFQETVAPPNGNVQLTLEPVAIK